MRHLPSALLVSGLLLLAIFEYLPLDLVVVRWAWDADSASFPLRAHPLLGAILYTGAKWASYLLGAVALVGLLRAGRAAVDPLARRSMLIAGLTLLLFPLLVVLLKHLTNRYCPWSLQEFGGAVPYTTLLQALPPQWQRGECFPAGHAAGGFVWVGVGIALRPALPAFGGLSLWFGLIAGFAMGLFRMAEGAHFLSHTLWTLWLGGFVPVLLARVLPPVRAVRVGS